MIINAQHSLWHSVWISTHLRWSSHRTWWTTKSWTFWHLRLQQATLLVNKSRLKTTV